MQQAKSNGQVGPAVPAQLPAPAATPPPLLDPIDQMRALFKKHGDRRYAEGYRAAIQQIARAIGQLDGEAKKKLGETLDALEDDLHAAEVAAR